jgi:cell division septum initiation protein DivIVA
VAITAREVEYAQFQESKRGYDQDQVENFRRAVIQAMQGYEAEITRLNDQLQNSSGRLKELEEAEEAVRRTYIAASQTKAEMIAEAEAEAQRLRNEARNEAHDLRTAVQREVDELRASAKTETDELRGTTQRETDELRATSEQEAQELRTQSREAADRMRAEADAAAAKSRADAETEAVEILGSARARAEEADRHTQKELSRLERRLEQLRDAVRDVEERLKSAADSALSDFAVLEGGIEAENEAIDALDRFAAPPSLDGA